MKWHILVFACLLGAGCVDEGDGHDDECDDLEGEAHDECHAGDDGDGMMGNMTLPRHEVTIRWTGPYAGPATQPGGYSAASITVPANHTIVLTFENRDQANNPVGRHDFVVDGIEGASTQVIAPGADETIEFDSGSPQSTQFYCSVQGHRGNGMEGTFIVE